MAEISVDSARQGSGWLVRVEVREAGRSSRFEVGVSSAELERFDPGASDPTNLVRRSFEFLLAREPVGSILSSFGISTIQRYFPEYERQIRRA